MPERMRSEKLLKRCRNRAHLLQPLAEKSIVGISRKNHCKERGEARVDVLAHRFSTELAIESMAVTTSGAASDIAVVGSFENTAAYANVQGFNILRVADEVYTWGGVNVPWLNSIIQNGQSVLVKAGGAVTAAEIKYLQEEGGYVRVG